MVKRRTPIKFNLYNDIKSFYKDTCELLMRHEEQNLIPLGNIIIGYEGKDRTEWREPASWFMATVSDTAGIKLTAIMTPPYNLTLHATDNVIDSEAINCLVEGMGFFQMRTLHRPREPDFQQYLPENRVQACLRFR
ncbi:MAG: hypothetical protein FWF26_00870 [Treponema sp.]|nr:hypothetical protein [Treponema sp.]